jgi:hypothetical protein
MDLRVLKINDIGGDKLLSVLGGGAIQTQVNLVGTNISFIVVLDKYESPKPSPFSLISRMDGQEKTFQKILGHYYKQFGLKENSPESQKQSVIKTLNNDLSYDLNQIANLV